MTLTEEDRVIYTDTGDLELARGTYKFTVIDNKGNKKELRITPTINSLFKVVYINGTDNMDNTNTYTKTQQSKTTAENTLINQLKANDSTKTYSRAITDSNKAITAITQTGRTAEDEKMYFYGKYTANTTYKYSVKEENQATSFTKDSYRFGGGYMNYSCGANGVTLSNYVGNAPKSTCYSTHISLGEIYGYNGPTTTTSNFYKFVYQDRDATVYTWKRYTMRVNKETVYSRGDFVSNLIAKDGTYTIGSTTQVHSDKYWYVRNSLAPKYTLQKYDSSLNLQSTYDVDTKILTTVPIDISNKGNNKVKLTLNTTGTNYKTYISNDNTNWQEVIEITSNTPKELNVDGWDNLFIKIETNTSRINNIDVAFYKD